MSCETLKVPAVRAGVFGKIPRHGDFVRLGMSDGLADGLDAWCAKALSELDLDYSWSRAPAWRFLLSPSMGTHDWVLGVVSASMDKAGRQFPLFLTGEIKSGIEAGSRARSLTAWLEQTLYWAFETDASGPELLGAVARCCTPLDSNDTQDDDVEGIAMARLLCEPIGNSAFWSLGSSTARGGLVSIGAMLTTDDFRTLFGSREAIE